MEQDNNTEYSSKLKNSLPFYGVIYIFVLIAIITAGYTYFKNIDFIAMNSKDLLPKQLDSAQAFMLDIAMKKGITSPPVDVYKLSVSTPELVAKGKGLFETTCSPCHGPEGKGDGPAGANLNPKPRNFHELSGWTNGPNFESMYITLQEGITNRGMASYANIPPEDRIAIINFLRTLNPNYPAVKQENLKALDDAYSLSKGVKQPNQIPVKDAIKKVLGDDAGRDSLIMKIDLNISSNTTDAGAVLFKSKVRDRVKAVNFLADNLKWNDNKNDLVKLIMSDPYVAGFKTEIMNLSDDEWNQLYTYLKGVFSTIKV
ncbi:MAG: cytochrome c [Bacteroidetes bacterium]|nr:cytochrome c [Bacteroidota bacterium]